MPPCKKCYMHKYTKYQQARPKLNPFKLPKIILFVDPPTKKQSLTKEMVSGFDNKLFLAQLFDANIDSKDVLRVPIIFCMNYDDVYDILPPVLLYCNEMIQEKYIDVIKPKIIIYSGKITEKYSAMYTYEKTKTFKIMSETYLQKTGGIASPFYGHNVSIWKEVKKCL